MDESPRVLGVDDSLTIRKALELVLRPAGYELELAGSGEEALQKAREFRPHILLLDFILPDMRGTEVCKRLAADPETASIPIVLISAKGAEIRQAYQDVGNVVTYIAKPFSPEDLTGAVTETLSRVREGAVALAAGAEAAAETAPQAEAEQEAPEVAPADAAAEAETLELEPGETWAAEEEVEEAETAPAAERRPRIRAGDRREVLEDMFEALRAGLEGVYVEEVDTPAGAAADEARSYTDLVSRLAQQLDETLEQARTGMGYRLSSDGSVRSLQENLFDAYRRVCRLLFRAVSAGAVEQEPLAGRARLLVVCRNESEMFETLRLLARANGDAHGLTVSDGFRQLPLLCRLFGPTHIIAESCPETDLWESLRLARTVPEGRRARLISVSAAGRPLADGPRQELDVDVDLENAAGLLASLFEQIRSAGRGGGESVEPTAEAGAGT